MSVHAEPTDIGSLHWGTAGERTAKVVLADHDPISRNVIGSALRAASTQAGQLEFLGCVDSTRPVDRWPSLSQTEVVVLSASAGEDHTAAIRALVRHGIRVLVLSARWDGPSLDRAIEAGATGCLLKDTEVDRIATAARAVASGYLLLSPELLEMYQNRTEKTETGPFSLKSSTLAITKREYEVLSLLAKGMNTTEVARFLGVTIATIKSHVSHALPKLNARNRVEAVLRIRGEESAAVG